jgi:hypothetical protein
MSRKGTASARYFDLEAAEDNDSEDEVDVTEVELGLINDEGDEDESVDGGDESDEGHQGDSGLDGELLNFFWAFLTVPIHYLLRWSLQVRRVRRCANGPFFGRSVV